MQRTFNRRSPVKQPKGINSSPRESGDTTSPFGRHKKSTVSAQPTVGEKGNFTQREKYVSGDPEVMSTQEKGPVVGDHSSIYLNTEEAATRLAEEGVNHNIEEALSQRI